MILISHTHANPDVCFTSWKLAELAALSLHTAPVARVGGKKGMVSTTSEFTMCGHADACLGPAAQLCLQGRST